MEIQSALFFGDGLYGIDNLLREYIIKQILNANPKSEFGRKTLSLR
ncbi:MAG: hypothetical protein ABIH72_05200 [archaeon]